MSALDSTDKYLNSLIRLSFETCLPPTFFQVASVALYSGLASSEHLWNTFVATSGPCTATAIVWQSRRSLC